MGNRKTKILSPELKAQILQDLCQSLLKADPEILEIVQFGSSAYAPDLSRDIDLLITTKSKKPPEVYWNATADFPLWVDILVREPGESIGKDIASSVCAFGLALYGNGASLKEARDFMPVLTYQDARDYLIIGDRDLSTAHQEPRVDLKDKYFRRAFDSLFHAARSAAMTFLNTENTRWGKLRGTLPEPFSERFRQIINTLHMDYWYHGNYPKDHTDEEYQHWRSEVTKFIEDLEKASRSP